MMENSNKPNNTGPQEIHYLSDFTVVLPMADSLGSEIGFPDFDFTVRLSCGGRVFRASCIGGEMVNLDNFNGQVRVIANNHGLQPGYMLAEVTAEIPDAAFPDGHRRTVWDGPVDIKLVTHGGQGITVAQAALSLPLVKGEPGKPGAPGRDAGIPVVRHDSSETSAVISPDTMHIWGVVEQLALEFAPEPDDGLLHEYMAEFACGDVPATLSVPDSVRWIAEPVIGSGCRYQISVVGGIGVIAGVES